MCHNPLRPLFVKAVKTAQLRHILSWPVWLPDSSKHILPYLAQRHGSCSCLHPTLCLSSKSPPWPWLPKGDSVSLLTSKQLYIKWRLLMPKWDESTFVSVWGMRGGCWWQPCPLALLQVGNSAYTPFVHNNLQECLLLFSLPNNTLGGSVLHEVIKKRKLSPFPSYLCFACISHYRCGGHSVIMSKTGGNK